MNMNCIMMPKLPGYDFENRLRQHHTVPHRFDMKNGHRIQRESLCGIGGEPLREEQQCQNACRLRCRTAQCPTQCCSCCPCLEPLIPAKTVIVRKKCPPKTCCDTTCCVPLTCCPPSTCCPPATRPPLAKSNRGRIVNKGIKRDRKAAPHNKRDGGQNISLLNMPTDNCHPWPWACCP